MQDILYTIMAILHQWCWYHCESFTCKRDSGQHRADQCHTLATCTQPCQNTIKYIRCSKH